MIGRVMAEPEEQFYSLDQVAERLQVSDQTVRRWIKSGKLAAYKPGREYRITPSDLDAFLESYSYPKVQAPLPAPPREASEEERRTIYDALQSLAMRKIADYDRELTTPDSPHFRDATSATLWIDGVQRDAAQWADWAIEEASTLASLE